MTVLTKLIYSLDDEVLIDACWAISYLSDGTNDKIQAVIESGVCRRLVDLLMHPSTAVQTPALRSVGNIVTGDDLQTQVVISSGALPALLSLLSSPKDGIRKEACWTISNVTAGSPHQIQAIIDANIIPPLINILQNADFKTKKEACWAISNATSGGLQEPNQIRYLVQQGCIKPMCDLLSSMDNKIIQVALDGLENILKVGDIDKEAGGPGAVNQYAQYVEEAGGMVAIHNLQHHENLEIYKKCFYIMDSESSQSSSLASADQQNSSLTTTRRRPTRPLLPSTPLVNTPSSRTVSAADNHLVHDADSSCRAPGWLQLRLVKTFWTLTLSLASPRHLPPDLRIVNSVILDIEYSLSSPHPRSCLDTFSVSLSTITPQ